MLFAIVHRYHRRMSSPRLTRGRNSERQAVYAVTIVTRLRRPLFGSTTLASIVREQLQLCDAEGITRTHAWVAMPDHVHWLFELRSDGLSACLQRFKSRSARAVNSIRTTEGAVWQAGFYDHMLRDEDDLLAQAQYIIDNPVRRGLVGNPHQYPHWGCRWIPNLNPDAQTRRAQLAVARGRDD